MTIITQERKTTTKPRTLTYAEKENLLPREKLMERGAKGLWDAELLAIILGSGVRGHSVYDIAYQLADLLDREWRDIDYTKIKDIPGIGEAKALGIIAALEFVRRRVSPAGVRINHPEEVYPLIKHYAQKKQEQLIGITLNGAHEVMEVRVITTGLINKTQVHPREVFADAIAERACSIIIAHNHPSGNVEPSSDDMEVTQRIKKAGNILGIPLLDHIVFSLTDNYSFAKNDLL